MEYDPKYSVLSPDTLVSQKRRAKANVTDVLLPLLRCLFFRRVVLPFQIQVSDRYRLSLFSVSRVDILSPSVCQISVKSKEGCVWVCGCVWVFRGGGQGPGQSGWNSLSGGGSRPHTVLICCISCIHLTGRDQYNVRPHRAPIGDTVSVVLTTTFSFPPQDTVIALVSFHKQPLSDCSMRSFWSTSNITDPFAFFFWFLFFFLFFFFFFSSPPSFLL